MKYLLSFCFLILTNLVSAQYTADTIFSEQDNDYGYHFYHAVFIEKDKTLQEYKKLADFEFNEKTKESFDSAYYYLSKIYPTPWKKQNIYELPENWIPLYSYKKQWYVYAPSEWGGLGKRSLNDSAFIWWFMDGPYPTPLVESKKINNRKYYFKIYSPFVGEQEEIIDIVIYILDTNNNICLWEYLWENKKTYYRIYIPNENAYNFDIVINYCKTDRVSEFEFDEIDYTSLKSSHPDFLEEK